MHRFVRASALIVAALTVFHTRAGLAQQMTRRPAPTDTETVRTGALTAVVVTASRVPTALAQTPAALSLVTRRVLEAAPRGIAVEEAVALVPGVKVDNQANGKRVHMSIRGQGILSEHGLRGIGVLLDGLPLNDPTGFAADLYDVDWSAVQHVEVQRGPAASLYGGSASAGVVNISTANGGSQPFAGELSANYGSNNFSRFTGLGGGTLGDVNYHASYSHTQGDGYRVHTAFQGDNVLAKAHWAPTASLRLTPMVWYTRFFNENAEGLNLTWLAQDRRQANPDALTFNEYMDTRRVTGGVAGELSLAQDRTLSFTAYLRGTQYRESVPSSIHHRALTAPGGTVQYTASGMAGAVRHHVSVGADLLGQSIDDYARPNMGAGIEGVGRLSDQTMDQTGVGVFALDRLDLSAQWSMTVNVRYDHIGNTLTDHLRAGGADLSGDATFERATGRVGMTWSPSPSLSVFGNVGQGFLPPATEELSANPAQIGGFNRDLQPAVSLSQEVGARGTWGPRVEYEVTLFHLTTDRDFDRYRVTSRPLETFYRNAAASRRYGLESYAQWTPTDALQLQAAYTYSDFKYTNSNSAYGDVRGHGLPNSPVHQLSADAQYRLTNALTIGASTDALSKWYVDPGNAKTVDGYALFNARASYAFRLGAVRYELTVAGRNLLGKQYIAFSEPDPDGNSYQPAAEREFFVGFRVQP